MRAFARRLPHPEPLLRATETMNAVELGDAVLANLACSVAEKALVAAEEDLAARLEHLLALFECGAGAGRGAASRRGVGYAEARWRARSTPRSFWRSA